MSLYSLQELSGIRKKVTMTTRSTNNLVCHICQAPLEVRLAYGRRSGKPFVLLVCPVNGRHIRAFVADQSYVRGVIERLEKKS